jgi:hypothetical protein
MLNRTYRTMTMALAVGALSLTGAGVALAAGGGSGAAPGGPNPLCTAPGSPLKSTPACTAAPQPPGHSARTGDQARSNDGQPPAYGDPPGPTHPLCEGGDALTGSPLCPSK